MKNVKKWMVGTSLKITIFYPVPGLHQPVYLPGLLFQQRTLSDQGLPQLPVAVLQLAGSV